MSGLQGYAVIDTETTGIHPGYHHRIAEVAVLHLDLDGNVIDEWCTLVNPERDLGPQSIHGIRAADVRNAPTFEQVAEELIRRLRGRIPVAHNWMFDAWHLNAEFSRLKISTPFDAHGGLCTMSAASRTLPRAGRSLMDCCKWAGIDLQDWHSALADARAAGALLRHLIVTSEARVLWTEAHLRTVHWAWPALPPTPVLPVPRSPRGHVEPHFLARMVDRIPRTGVPAVDAYLAMLDAALLDRDVSATEADALIDLAYELGLHRAEVVDAHYGYLRVIARAAWADGVASEEELGNLQEVAQLLGVDDESVNQLLEAESVRAGEDAETAVSSLVNVDGLVLQAGTSIVLTGTMGLDRATWTQQAEVAGLVVGPNVTKKTQLVVAADPDTFSGKAKKARLYGVPVVSEAAFAEALGSLLGQRPRSSSACLSR